MPRPAATPRIHALLLVRDEGDIIEQCLDHLLTWAEGVYVLDTGSTDATWDIVRSRAAREPSRVFASQTDAAFQCGLRSILFRRHRRHFRPGDWIARVDADEFYHTDPREFLRESVAPHEGRVAALQYLFVLTRPEADAWHDGRETLADRARPIEDRRRHYMLDGFPELRFFRYRPTMRWFPERPDPANPGPVAARRIPIRHYRFRDPPQIRARMQLRQRVAAATPLVGRHWANERIHHAVFNADDPRLHHWQPGTPLPDHAGQWPEPDAHLGVDPTGRLGRFCHARGLAWILDLLAR